MTDEIKKSKEQLREECAPVLYREVERFFARGMLIVVAAELDILDVAVCVQDDDSEQMSRWIENNMVTRATDDHARGWSKTETALMAVTVVPWVLVQEII